MLKLVSALFAGLIAGWALVGSTTTASAHYRHYGCCGPVAPSYIFKTKKVYKNYTHVRNVWRTKYVKRNHLIVHVTRIQPIVHVHNITRVHTKVVGMVRNVHVWKTKYLPAKKYYTNQVVHLRPHCACSHHHY